MEEGFFSYNSGIVATASVNGRKAEKKAGFWSISMAMLFIQGFEKALYTSSR
jgi:hypothetical protein